MITDKQKLPVHLQPDAAAMEMLAELDQKFFAGQFAAEGGWRVWVVDWLTIIRTYANLYDGARHRSIVSDRMMDRAAAQCRSVDQLIWLSERKKALLAHEMCHAEVSRNEPKANAIRLGYYELGYEHDGRFIAELTRLAAAGEQWAAYEAARYGLENIRRVLVLKDDVKEKKAGNAELRRLLRRTLRDLSRPDSR
jgi:hypothetical protein